MDEATYVVLLSFLFRSRPEYVVTISVLFRETPTNTSLLFRPYSVPGFGLGVLRWYLPFTTYHILRTTYYLLPTA